jgi:hypothetical protein
MWKKKNVFPSPFNSSRGSTQRTDRGSDEVPFPKPLRSASVSFRPGQMDSEPDREMKMEINNESGPPWSRVESLTGTGY